MIRKAIKTDANNIAKLIIESWKTAYRGLMDDTFLDNMSLNVISKGWEKHILSQNSDNHIYVYVENNTIIGIIRFGNTDDKNDNKHNAEIHVLYVEPALKRKGIGKQLFKFAETYFIDHSSRNLIIWCLKGNEQAINFYKKMGGKIVAERETEVNGAKVTEVGVEYSLTDKIILVKPDKTFEKQAIEYKKEHSENGEKIIHAASAWDKMDNYDEWLDLLEKQSSWETMVNDWTVHSTFFGVRESDGKIVGMIDIRHELNSDFLKNYAGHIGYGIRPTERRKGYVTQMLRQALDFCRDELKLDKVMISCEKDNEGSRRTIINAGGKLEKEYISESGEAVQIYWVKL